MKKHFDIYVPEVEFYEIPGSYFQNTTSTNQLRYPEPRTIDLRDQSNKVFEILAKSKR